METQDSPALKQQSLQLFDDLRPEEYDALKADIAKRGQIVPIEIDGETGQIIDGNHRLKICKELGIEPQTVSRTFSGDKDRTEHALVLNLLRRHLGPISWARAFERLLEVRGVERKPGPKEDSATVALIARELGVPKRTAFRRLQLKDQLSDHPDLAEKVDTGDQTAKRALRVIRERKAVERRVVDPAPEPTGLVTIYHKDFRELEIEPQSVDLIFTDPPYGKEYLSLYGDLAKFAARALKPGALLVTYSGQFYLPEVIRQLEEHLNYVWTGAIWINGQHGVVRPLQIWYRYKPLFFFSAGPYEPKGWFEDVVSASQEKSLHDWQQSLDEALYFLEKLSGPGNLIVDPFLGAGTTGLAAKQLGRSFIGCDVDPAAIDTAKRRLG